MYIRPEKIKCAQCGSINIDLNYAAEIDYETGRVVLLFECDDCYGKTEVKAIAFDIEHDD